MVGNSENTIVYPLSMIQGSVSSSVSHSFQILNFVCYVWLPFYKLPYSIKILLESAIRNCDEFQVKSKDIEKIIDWENTSPKQVEIPFKPARVLLQIFRLLRYFEIFWIDRSWTDFGGSTLVYSTTFFYLPR
ncbi:hypothetical protein V6N11_040370 [Hibiscus sabdariffa]|uniref:Uncharacterized protein n=1 Tax=Hibiscus sabdariffa TaxID=183260 RepID=A0ABR2RHM9_9ROSI